MKGMIAPRRVLWSFSARPKSLFKIPIRKLKRWKTGLKNKTRAGEIEALIKADLLKGNYRSEKISQMTFAQWGKVYLSLEEVKRLRSYRDRVGAG